MKSELGILLLPGSPRGRAAQCIDKEILIRKNGNIDIDIEIDKRMF